MPEEPDQVPPLVLLDEVLAGKEDDVGLAAVVEMLGAPKHGREDWVVGGELRALGAGGGRERGGGRDGGGMLRLGLRGLLAVVIPGVGALRREELMERFGREDPGVVEGCQARGGEVLD